MLKYASHIGLKNMLLNAGMSLARRQGCDAYGRRPTGAMDSMVARYIASRRHGRSRKPRKLVGDKDCSVQRVRDWLRAQGIEPVIPHKANENARHDPIVRFDRQTYRQRHVVEQCVGWLKEFRRIGTRFEKLAGHFHGMLQLAMIRRYLKLLFSDRT
ncbi:MAG: transposase [Phycisphaerae bacterium]